ncbi:hypothetical protein ABMA32_17140 [Mesorhizobium sp. VNQ89]|uniref:hypothetical protein n=1 Tax=Mesorhizobium quangtriensis TaxID=3157709 RepID=UPI0032B7B783
MKERFGARMIVAAPLLVSGLVVSGCMSSPTYGTGVSANEQLASDISGMLSMAPKRTSAEYAPRAELVKPTKPTTELPAPQDSIVTADAGQWPESPEQRRARLRAEATENQDDPNWNSGIVNDLGTSPGGASKNTKLGTSGRSSESGVAKAGEAENLNALGAKARQAKAVAMQGSPTVRRTLTEPPLDYRQPAATAATDDLGEPEYQKQRRLKAEAKAGGKKTFKDYIPWL